MSQCKRERERKAWASTREREREWKREAWANMRERGSWLNIT